MLQKITFSVFQDSCRFYVLIVLNQTLVSNGVVDYRFSFLTSNKFPFILPEWDDF